MTDTKHYTLPVLLALILTTAFSPLATAAFTVPKDIDETTATKVFLIGNSHTDTIRERMAGLAEIAGKDYTYGTHSIPGAPLRWLYDHENGSLDALKNHAWDVLTLQSYNSTTEEEIQAAINFTGAALEGNPEVRVIMYAIWPPVEEWNDPPLGRRQEWCETVAQRVREAHPGVNIAVAPTSMMIRELGNLADDGLVPGMMSKRDVFSDSAHMGDLGGYAIACTILSLIYDEPPMQWPNEVATRGGYGGYTVDEATAATIKRFAYDILAQYEPDNFDTGMVIHKGLLPPAVVGKEYKQPLPVVNAPGPVQWEVVSGDLPAGLQVREGHLIGTPTQAVEGKGAVFTVKATSGSETAERELRIDVDVERPLAITDAQIPQLRRDEFLQKELQAEGNIGRVTWSVAEGELPPGFKLFDTGLLRGTPGKPGSFPVTFQVKDQHPEEPRTAQKEVVIEVGEMSPGSIAVQHATDKWELDGELNETFWNFDRELKTADGQTVGVFSIVWHSDPENRRPERTRKLLIGVKVPAADQVSIPTQAVHLFVDLIHNREIIYNVDDFHYILTREGKQEIVQGYRHMKRFDKAVKTNDDGSWQAEIEIQNRGFEQNDVFKEFGPHATYGFDIAVGSIEDPQARGYWHGDASIEEDTSSFGSIVIEAEE